MEKLFDTHLHLFDRRFGEVTIEKISQRITQANKQKIGYFCNVGLDLKTSQTALEIAQKFPNGYSACGFHPTLVNQWTEQSEQTLLNLLKEPKVVAIGEIGLDYFHHYTTPEQQQKILRLQLKIAEKTKTPVLLHIRDAYDQALEIVKKFQVTGIVHCFSGTLTHAQEFIKLGFVISFSGVVTFHNAKPLQAIAKVLPLEKIVLETDAPYLAPMPFRGKINQPEYLLLVAEKIATLKQISLSEVITQTTINAKRVFGLD